MPNPEPKCYKCKHRRNIPGDAHSSCAAAGIDTLTWLKLAGKGPEFDACGINNGWVYWPLNFDPVWLKSCNYFDPKTP